MAGQAVTSSPQVDGIPSCTHGHLIAVPLVEQVPTRAIGLEPSHIPRNIHAIRTRPPVHGDDHEGADDDRPPMCALLASTHHHDRARLPITGKTKCLDPA